MFRRASVALIAAAFLTAPLVADDGELDPSFWGDGKVTLDATADYGFGGLAADVDGGMAVAYSYVPPVGGVEVGAWRRVGDSTLGGACLIEPYPSGVRDTRVFDAAFDAAGRLLVLARESYEDPVMGGMEAWYILAYSYPDCALDTSFSGDGIATIHGWDMTGLQGYARLQPLADGTTLVTGHALSGGPSGCRVHVITLSSNGSSGPSLCAPPSTFPVQAYGADAVLAPNGHVVAIAGTDDFRIVDFAPGGTIANVVAVAFDLGGGLHDEPTGIAATDDGGIVVVGAAEDSGPQVYVSAAVAMLRWTAQGVLQLDPSFSGDGKLDLAIESLPYSYLEDVVVQGDGKIVAAGGVTESGGNSAMAVIRLNPNGSFDGDFNPDANGVQLVDFNVGSPFGDLGYRGALQNGRVVVAGTVDISNGIRSVGVARLLNSYVFADGFEAPQAPGWIWID